MKFNSIIASLPAYTSVSCLYTLLGSINASAINAASREVAADIKALDAAAKEARNVISIDKYNELLNELRQKQYNDEHVEEVGFDHPEHARNNQRAFLDNLMILRTPLLAMLNSTQAQLPKRDGVEQADFSFEESLARQLAQEFTAQAIVDGQVDQALIDSGAVTEEELNAADQQRFDANQQFRTEFKFLILDKLRDREPTTVDEDDANAAFDELPFEYQTRLLNKLLPKLMEAKRQQLGRRMFDPDATTNIMILGLAINEFKKHVGDSAADQKLAQLQAALAA